MALTLPVPELNVDNLIPDIAISIPPNYCAVVTRQFEIQTAIIVTIGLSGYLRIL